MANRLKPLPGLSLDRAHPLSQGLVGWWLFNEGAGQVTQDYSGNSNNGTFTNSIADWVGSPLGRALNFNGGTDVINIGSPSILDDLPQITVSARINPRTLGGGGLGFIVAKAVGSSPSAGWSFMLDGGDRFRFIVDYVTTSLRRESPNNQISFNTWQHVAATWDGSALATGVRLYHSGVEVASYNDPDDGVGGRVSDASSSLQIGNNSSGSRGVDGFIDDVRIYNRILSPLEVNQLFFSPFANVITSPQSRRVIRHVNRVVTARSRLTSKVGGGLV